MSSFFSASSGTRSDGSAPSWRDQLVAVVIGYVFIRKIRIKRRVELEDAPIHEPEDGVREDGLCHRRRLQKPCRVTGSLVAAFFTPNPR